MFEGLPQHEIRDDNADATAIAIAIAIARRVRMGLDQGMFRLQ